MKLSIVIVNWNVSALLEACLESVYQNASLDDMEVWLVDNASTDGSVEMVKAIYPQAKLIISDVNIGFGPANNLALRQCNGEYILLLNPDTLVLPGAIKTLQEYLANDPGVGCVGPMLINPDQSLQVSCFPNPTLYGELLRLLHMNFLGPERNYRMEDWQPVSPRKVDILQGTCLLIPKAVLDKVGFFDENFFMYSEEVDLCYRIQKGGWDLTWVPGSKIIHYGGQSTQQVASEMFLRLYQGKLKFFHKHHGRFAAMVYKLILFLSSIVRLVVIPIVWVAKPSGRIKNKKIAENYFRLLITLPRLEAM